ncbi:hypothetical protein H8D30_02380 [bacterium]|nr:hypothetical protein [bacterium]
MKWVPLLRESVALGLFALLLMGGVGLLKGSIGLSEQARMKALFADEESARNFADGFTGSKVITPQQSRSVLESQLGVFFDAETIERLPWVVTLPLGWDLDDISSAADVGAWTPPDTGVLLQASEAFASLALLLGLLSVLVVFAFPHPTVSMVPALPIALGCTLAIGLTGVAWGPVSRMLDISAIAPMGAPWGWAVVGTVGVGLWRQGALGKKVEE